MLNRKTYFFLAVTWTAIVTFLSLASLGDVGSSIKIQGKDKVVHFTFYFVFVLFWNFFFKKDKKSLFTTIIILLFAIEYGVFMEICQGTFTTNRTPDILDIIANSSGAIAGWLFIVVYYKKRKPLIEWFFCIFIPYKNSKMNIKQYLDSTYLKTPEQAGLSDKDNAKVVEGFIQEAIDENFKLIMIRPDMVKLARTMIAKANSNVTIGTVIGFPEGTYSLEEKLAEAQQAIEDGVDDLDYVCNYEAFKRGEINLVKNEILEGTKLGLAHHKIVKWIIEVAALSNDQIIQLSTLIKNVVMSNFKEESYSSVFVKSSTGFYKTENGLPNGATVPTIIMMLENASPLPVKAAGGVRTYEEAVAMIQLGVKRIGTSSAKAIANGEITNSDY